MGRRKIEIKAIKDDRNRSVTFLKRKGGLFKKAHELSVLCSVDVAVIIFGHNKKLYEFSSGDINEIIGRYQYYGSAHEHKGPNDFSGGKDGDDDDDDEMGSPPPESHSSHDHAMMAHQIHGQPGYQHMRHHTPSASPPISNGGHFHQRNASHDGNISRPASRTAMPRPSSNLATHPGPQSQASHGAVGAPAPATAAATAAAAAPPPPPAPAVTGHDSYAYVPNPSLYNPQAAAGMPMQAEAGHGAHPYPYTSQAGGHAPAPAPYLGDQRRLSRSHPLRTERAAPAAESPPPQPGRAADAGPAATESMLEPPKRSTAKSQSIFTPVEESRSLLARHWTRGPSSNEHEPSSEPAVKPESSVVPARPPPPPPPPPPLPLSEARDGARAGDGSSAGASQARLSGPGGSQARNHSISSVPDFLPPSRAGSGTSVSGQGGKRPRLKVQIPDEGSDGGSATGGSSPKDSAVTGGAPSGKGGTEGSHSSGVVLPPPSPSASALLSAGATGPTNPFNPFPRPNPPGNSNETPISALPSRFMADGLLPSPSSFYPEWGFSRTGGESNMLPSPLNFQTPVAANGPSFGRDESEPMKRKSPDAEATEGAPSKRMKA